MSKFKPYESPIDFIARKVPFVEFLDKLYYKYNKFDSFLNSSGRDPRSSKSPYFLGGLNPLIAMGKDFLDTFKPYKSRFYIFRDLLQPLRGLGNVIRGLFNLIATPILFLINTARYAIMAIQAKSFQLFLENMALNLIKSGGGLLDGITSIIRGISQIITTPLTWFIRMPLRGIITAVKGMPTFLNSFKSQAEETATLIKREDREVEDSILIDRKMGSVALKIAKALARGQELGVSQEALLGAYDKCRSFTERKLSPWDYLQAKLGGGYYVSNDSYYYRKDEDEYTRKSALNFLSIFSTGQIPEETDTQERHQALEAWDRLTDRKFL